MVGCSAIHMILPAMTHNDPTFFAVGLLHRQASPWHFARTGSVSDIVKNVEYISCILSIIVRITCAIQSSMDLDGYGKSTTPSKCVGLNDSVATSICRGGAGHETCNNLQRQYGSGLARTTCPPCGALMQNDGVSKDVLVLCWPLL